MRKTASFGGSLTKKGPPPIAVLHIRDTSGLHKTNTLFVTTTASTPITCETLARWTRNVMQKLGIDISYFKPYSTRSASASKETAKSRDLIKVLELGKWQSTSTFFKYYLRKVKYFKRNTPPNSVTPTQSRGIPVDPVRKVARFALRRALRRRQSTHQKVPYTDIIPAEQGFRSPPQQQPSDVHDSDSGDSDDISVCTHFTSTIPSRSPPMSPGGISVASVDTQPSTHQFLDRQEIIPDVKMGVHPTIGDIDSSATVTSATAQLNDNSRMSVQEMEKQTFATPLPPKKPPVKTTLKPCNHFIKYAFKILHPVVPKHYSPNLIPNPTCSADSLWVSDKFPSFFNPINGVIQHRTFKLLLLRATEINSAWVTICHNGAPANFDTTCNARIMPGPYGNFIHFIPFPTHEECLNPLQCALARKSLLPSGVNIGLAEDSPRLSTFMDKTPLPMTLLTYPIHRSLLGIPVDMNTGVKIVSQEGIIVTLKDIFYAVLTPGDVQLMRRSYFKPQEELP